MSGVWLCSVWRRQQNRNNESRKNNNNKNERDKPKGVFNFYSGLCWARWTVHLPSPTIRWSWGSSSSVSRQAGNEFISPNQPVASPGRVKLIQNTDPAHGDTRVHTRTRDQCWRFGGLQKGGLWRKHNWAYPNFTQSAKPEEGSNSPKRRDTGRLHYTTLH